MSDRRSAVFLEEMGVGPQWRLRDRPAPAADAAAAIAPAEQPMAAPLPPVHAESAPAAQHAPSQPDSPADASYAAIDEQHASSEAPGERGNVESPPAAPARVPGTPSIASTGEDMSWFDDAPTPEFKPQRKKVAAPEQPRAASPSPMSPARPAPAAVTGQAPAYDDIQMDEPPGWFDDEQPATTSGTGRTAGQLTDAAIAQMDWPSLQAAVASCTRCARCETRQQAVPGRGDEQATWIALDTGPGQTEDQEGYQFAGDPGYLLDNMLKAVGQTSEKGAYLTSLVKCHAPYAPNAEELQACRPYLQRELELTQAKVMVAFGHSTGKGLLGGAARGRIMLHGSVPVVATYHPADLLKKPEEKAKAWQDLCLAKAAHAGRR